VGMILQSECVKYSSTKYQMLNTWHKGGGGFCDQRAEQ